MPRSSLVAQALASAALLLTPAITQAQGELAGLPWVVVDTALVNGVQLVRRAAVDGASPAGLHLLVRHERTPAGAGAAGEGSTRIDRLRCDGAAPSPAPVAFAQGVGDSVTLTSASPEYLAAFQATVRREYAARSDLRALYPSVDAMQNAVGRRQCAAARAALRRAGRLPSG